MTEALTKDNYVMKFGKYKNMLIKDVAKITTIDKNGKTKKDGLQYLQWLITTCDWFKHQTIVKELLDDIDKEIDEHKEEKKVEKNGKK